MKKFLVCLIATLLCGVIVYGQSANANYPEPLLMPSYAADTGSVNVLTASMSSGCPTVFTTGMLFKVLPLHANTTSTPTMNWCNLGAKTITKFGTTVLASNDLTTTAIAIFIYDGTDMELANPQTATGTGTVISIATTSPITGGTITTTGTIACGTCVTSAAGLASTDLITGSGSQGVQANANDTVNTGGIFTLYDNLTTAGLGFPTVLGVSDVTAQSTSQSTVNLVASTGFAGHYLVRLYIDQNALCTTGTGNVYATIGWTDATHAHTALTIPLTLANGSISSTTGFVDAAVPLWAASSTAITYTTTYTACTSGTGTYDLHAEVERTN